MKDFNDLLNSGISDELLAAYIDGNTTESENQLIENTLNGDSMLSEAYEIANDSVSFGSNFDWELHKGDFGFWELGLPPVITEREFIADDVANNNDSLYFPSPNIEDFVSSGDSFLNTDESIDTNNLDIDDEMLDGSDILDL